MNRSIIFILLLFCVSCTNRYDVPSGIIQKDKMGDIMWDLIQAQTFAKEVHNKDTSLSLSKTSLTFTEQVYRVHHISKKEFDESYKWYQSRPDILRVVFDSLYTQKQRDNVRFIQKKYDNLGQDSLRTKFLKNAKDL